MYLGWNYAIDPNYDSLDDDGRGNTTAGGTLFEIYRMAVKDDVSANTIWIAINANLPLEGANVTPREDYEISNGNQGYGDLFFDFSGTGNFKNASDSNSLFGIRFAPSNDSNVQGTGVYSGVKAKSVIAQNAGWSNLYNHNINAVLPLTGMDAAMGFLDWNDVYYSPYITEGSHKKPETLIPNIIESGNKIGDITMVDGAALAAAGFILGDPEYGELGTHTIGFKFDKSLLPVGSYVASLILECNNDAIALEGETQPHAIPEPSLIFGTLLGFGAIVAKRKRQQKLGA